MLALSVFNRFAERLKKVALKENEEQTSWVISRGTNQVVGDTNQSWNCKLNYYKYFINIR